MEVHLSPRDAGVWAAQDTSPAKIEGALRALLEEQHKEDEAYVRASVMNLVVIVDRDWKGEIVNRLERVGRYHPSRTIICAVERGRTSLDARAVSTAEEREGLTVAHEAVHIDLGPRHLAGLETVVDPLVIPDLMTAVWSPHGFPEAVDALQRLAQVVLIDSLDQPDLRSAVDRATTLSERSYVVDLAWLRSTPWRERVAATFDPPKFRSRVFEVSGVTVRHRSDSAISGLLLLGWLASRLGWEPGSFVSRNGSMQARARSKRHEVTLRLQAEERQEVPGLSGLTLETAAGGSLSLNRGPGGLTAVSRSRDGRESSWTILGASRGEAGILGEGIRQALLRDPTYRPALEAAAAMLS